MKISGRFDVGNYLKSRLKIIGMAVKKMYRNTLGGSIGFGSIGFALNVDTRASVMFLHRNVLTFSLFKINKSYQNVINKGRTIVS